jgi:hypothetical protein
VNFAADETSRTITIAASGDLVAEPDETFTVALSNASGNAQITASEAAGTITNDDTALSIAAADAVKPEGDAGIAALTFTLTRTGVTTGATTVDYAVTGSGSNPADAVDFGGTLPTGQVSFAADETSKTITIEVSGDVTVEPDEGFTVTLSNASGNVQIATAEGAGTITNDDTALSIAATDAVKPEGNSGMTALTFTVTRTGVTAGSTTVDYTVTGSGASAADAVDFGGTLPSGQVSFAADEASRTITIEVSGDVEVEPDEGFAVTLSNPSGDAQITTSEAAGTIANDDADVVLTMNPQTVPEDGSTNLAYTFTRTGATSEALTVHFSVGGSATLDADYVSSGAATFSATTGTVTFAAGNNTTVLTVDPVSDTTVEPDETVVLALTPASGYNVAVPSAATGTIANDDAEVRLAVTPLVVTEDGATNLLYTFTRSGATSGPLTVNFAVGGTAAFNTDYTQTGAATFTATSGTLAFSSGSSTATVSINPAADSLVEPAESAILTLGSGSGYTVAGSSVATGTISNDDQATLTIEVTKQASEDATDGELTVTTNKRFQYPVTLNLGVGGSATAGTDYVAPGPTVTFPANRDSIAIPVTVIGDNVVEPPETLTVTLTGTDDPAVTIAPANNAATVTIGDNDTAAVSFASAASDVFEFSGRHTIDVILTVANGGTLGADLTVDVIELVADSTATSADYSLDTGSVTFAAGSGNGEVRTIDLTVFLDDVMEDDETVNLQLQIAGGGIGDQVAVGSPNRHLVTIAEDPGTAGVSGVVWADTNGNGVRDDGEAAVPGVTITLVGEDVRGETVEIITVTDGSGGYHFREVPAGTFDIVQTHPKAFHDGTELLGKVNDVPSGEVGDDRFIGVVLEADQQGANYDFGELGLRARYVNVRMLLASTPPAEQLLRATIAEAERQEGDPDHAEAIRQQMAAEVRRVGPEVKVTGGDAGDTVEFIPASSHSATDAGRHTIELNGIARGFDAAEVNAFVLDGGGGDDELRLRDTTGDDSLEATGNVVTLLNDDFRLEAVAFELARAISESGGDDKAQEAAIDFALELEGDWETL